MKGLTQITDSNAIMKGIDEVVANNPRPLEQHRAGRKALFGFFGDGIEPRGAGQGWPECAFVGQTMKATQDKANPALRIGGDSRRWPPTAP